MNKITVRCPYHPEKTGSCSIDLDKEIYQCFGCGKHGNLSGMFVNLGYADFYNLLDSARRHESANDGEVALHIKTAAMQVAEEMIEKAKNDGGLSEESKLKLHEVLSGLKEERSMCDDFRVKFEACYNEAQAITKVLLKSASVDLSEDGGVIKLLIAKAQDPLLRPESMKKTQELLNKHFPGKFVIWEVVR